MHGLIFGAGCLQRGDSKDEESNWKNDDGDDINMNRQELGSQSAIAEKWSIVISMIRLSKFSTRL